MTPGGLLALYDPTRWSGGGGTGRSVGLAQTLPPVPRSENGPRAWPLSPHQDCGLLDGGVAPSGGGPLALSWPSMFQWVCIQSGRVCACVHGGQVLLAQGGYSPSAFLSTRSDDSPVSQCPCVGIVLTAAHSRHPLRPGHTCCDAGAADFGRLQHSCLPLQPAGRVHASVRQRPSASAWPEPQHFRAGCTAHGGRGLHNIFCLLRLPPRPGVVMSCDEAEGQAPETLDGPLCQRSSIPCLVPVQIGVLLMHARTAEGCRRSSSAVCADTWPSPQLHCMHDVHQVVSRTASQSHSLAAPSAQGALHSGIGCG